MMKASILASVASLALAAGAPTSSTRAWELPPGVKALHVNGYDMAYVERGSGQPVLLVHGGVSDFRYWSGVMDPLAAKYRVVAISLRHHYPERWDGKDDSYSMQQHVSDLVAFIRKLGAGPVHLVGISRGGRLALYLARAQGELVRTLTVAEGASGFAAFADPAALAQRQAGHAKTRALLEQGKIDDALANFVNRVNGPGSWETTPEWARQMFRDNLGTMSAESSSGSLDPYTCADAGRIAAPVLLVGGERSPAFFGKALDKLQPCLKRCERVVIPNASHGMARQNPAGFSEAVLAFISKH
jgi:pimeloyl-ACP methyl ester carboxylesterase